MARLSPLGTLLWAILTLCSANAAALGGGIRGVRTLVDWDVIFVSCTGTSIFFDMKSRHHLCQISTQCGGI